MSEMTAKATLPACPVETTLTLIGDKWKVLILRDLMPGTKRFGELKKSVGNVSQKVLTAQLRAMEESGLVNRKVYAEVPPRVEYSLTELGKSLKPILPIVLFTAVLNLFFVSGEGDPVFKLGFLTVYAEGIRYAVLMAVRVMALIAGTSLLTYTTSPIVLTDAIEQLLKPLGRLHFPVHELAMMMSIALRFIPTLIEETDKIMNAQKARGAQLDNGKMTERIKALVPVLVPLFISAFRRADELAMAMECRCYRGGDGRTRLKVLRCEKQDYIDLAVCIACFAVILASRLVFPNF